MQSEVLFKLLVKNNVYKTKVQKRRQCSNYRFSAGQSKIRKVVVLLPGEGWFISSECQQQNNRCWCQEYVHAFPENSLTCTNLKCGDSDALNCSEGCSEQNRRRYCTISTVIRPRAALSRGLGSMQDHFLFSNKSAGYGTQPVTHSMGSYGSFAGDTAVAACSPLHTPMKCRG